MAVKEAFIHLIGGIGCSSWKEKINGIREAFVNLRDGIGV